MSFFRTQKLACCAVFAVALPAVWGAVSITDVNVTNIGATTFTVVWKTSEESTAGLDVFSDAAGAHAITASLGVEFYPIHEGDPGVVNSPTGRARRRALELLAMHRMAVAVRVSGLAPGTTYYVRPRTYDSTGTDNGDGPVPLKPATTAQFTGMVTDARIFRIQVPTFAAEGMVLVVQGPAGTTPLSAIVGDSAAQDVALFSTAGIVDTGTGTNALFTSPQTFLIRAIGSGAPSTTFSQTIAFTGDFKAAAAESFAANIESPAPLITQHPVDAIVPVGTTAAFTVAVTATPAPTYAWQRKPAGSGTWSNLTPDATYSGVSAATLSVAGTTLAMTGDQFRVFVTNGVPPDATSDAATLTVTAAAIAPTITIQPLSASVVAGVNATFTVAASGTPAPGFHWQRKPAGSGTWSDLIEGGGYAGVATTMLTVSGTTLGMSGDQFRAIAGNGVPPDATSNSVSLTVTSTAIAPAITNQPLPRSVGVGSDTTFAVAASGTPTPTYRWQIQLAGSGTWLDLTETPNYSGVATAMLTVKSATLAMSGDQFRAIATNGTPPDATSDAVALTVVAMPTITQQPQAAAVAAGGNTSFAVIATGTGTVTYQWQRRAIGSADWQDLADNAMFQDTDTATMRILGALFGMNGDQFRCVVTDTIGSVTTNAAMLTVSKGIATVTLGSLHRWYDGTPRVVSATTVPAGLTVVFSYNGTPDAPFVPGNHAVTATIDDPMYAGSASGELVVRTNVLARHMTTLLGVVEGSAQVLTPEGISVTGSITGDLLVVGTPSVTTAPGAALGGTRDGPGATAPGGYTVTFGATSSTRNLVRFVDAVTMPTVPAPPVPAGTRNVTLTAAGQSAGDFATVRNLNVSGSVGLVTVPPGTYGSFIANGSAGFVFGVAGATDPAVYNLQSLSINPLLGTAKLVVVGPVIINVANSVTIYGETGAALHPEWLSINVATGSLSTNSRGALYGSVVAPASAVTLNGSSTITGAITADTVKVTAGGRVKQAP
jgi:hypothetical protein